MKIFMVIILITFSSQSFAQFTGYQARDAHYIDYNGETFEHLMEDDSETLSDVGSDDDNQCEEKDSNLDPYYELSLCIDRCAKQLISDLRQMSSEDAQHNYDTCFQCCDIEFEGY